MKIEKIFNNNVISTHAEDGKEIVIMGCGLAFGKKAGDTVEHSKVEKIFEIKNDTIAGQYAEMLENIPFEYVELSNDVIAYAEKRYKMKLNQSVYITLPDHIHFSVEKIRQGIFATNAILWEIKKFYNSEYQVGRHAVRLIKERIGIGMSDDEAGFIALHFLNAEYDANLNNVMLIPEQIENILAIVKHELQIELDESSLHYERFLTHLKFLLQRVYKKELLNSDDKVLADMMKTQYPNEYRCSEKIVEYINEKIGSQISEEETMYLSMHIKRVSITERKEERNA